jgi:pyrroloquinoline quinone biosynthesis protein D
MSERALVNEESAPRLAAHARLHFDKQRDQWMLLAPERLFVLDPIALAIVERCKGEANVAAIVDDLVATYNAPRDRILMDVTALLQDLTDKGIMTQ